MIPIKIQSKFLRPRLHRKLSNIHIPLWCCQRSGEFNHVWWYSFTFIEFSDRKLTNAVNWSTVNIFKASGFLASLANQVRNAAQATSIHKDEPLDGKNTLLRFEKSFAKTSCFFVWCRRVWWTLEVVPSPQPMLCFTIWVSIKS